MEDFTMKWNCRFAWILALLLTAPVLPVIASAAPYQGGYGGGMGGRRGNPMEQLRQLTKALDLTSDQQAKLKPILVAQQKKLNEVRDNPNLDHNTMRDKMMQIRKDTNNQVRALLDDKQKEKFDKMEQEREDRMQNRRGGPAGPGGDNSGGNTPAPPPPQN
jgi:periplasmic protein CpxP/Spy